MFILWFRYEFRALTQLIFDMRAFGMLMLFWPSFCVLFLLASHVGYVPIYGYISYIQYRRWKGHKFAHFPTKYLKLNSIKFSSFARCHTTGNPDTQWTSASVSVSASERKLANVWMSYTLYPGTPTISSHMRFWPLHHQTCKQIHSNYIRMSLGKIVANKWTSKWYGMVLDIHECMNGNPREENTY